MRLGTNIPEDKDDLNKTKVISQERNGNHSPNPNIVVSA